MAKRVAGGGVKLEWWWQLRIELLGVTPAVWRRLFVPETIKLPKLHRIFQAAMGWTDSHLHEFIMGGVRYSDPDPDIGEELEHVDEKNVVLVRALGLDARCFDYVYDFGDDWHHIVVVEDRQPHSGVAPSLIHCGGGANACPPEDAGGAQGYARYLEAIADPDHEEHEEYLEWCGVGFDAKRFDLDAVNLALSKIKSR
jgi:hypothetical protein